MKTKKSDRIGELIISLFVVLLAFVGTHNALSPDGQALISFKLGMRSSDGVLMKWKESDRDPCGWPGVTCDLQTKRVVALSLPFRKLWGRIAPDVGNLDQLRTLRLHQNSLYGTIPPELGNCSHLKALYLQGNFLSGAIPIELGKLNNLEVLDISSNSLSGIIPPSLGNLERLSNLNVSTNFLIGQIPQNGVLRNFKGDSFVGNLGLCGEQVAEICKSQLEGPALTPDSSTPLQGITGLKKKSNKYSTGLLISAFSTVGVSLLVALMCFWGCFLYNRFWKNTKAPEIDLPMTPKVVIFHGDLPYTSKEIVKKIELLNESNIIGQGGFGTVYRIVMDDRSMFAVKSISKINLHSDRIFERELEVLGSIKHRNLVNLRGYCNSPSAKLLIYDYLPNGSLEEALHERDLEEASSINLSWGSRLRIALGAARGIAYLHHDCSPRIIHRDIKSSNILLGDNFEPHVSDFGLAKLLEDHDSHVTTVLAGTFGYLAPEYMQSGRATEKADVYSYGVVALELISGKRPNDAFFVEKGLNVVGWVNLLVKERNYEEILDPRCEYVQMDSLEAIIHIATLCINPAPDERPTMHHVVKMLESEITSPCPSDFYEESNSE